MQPLLILLVFALAAVVVFVLVQRNQQSKLLKFLETSAPFLFSTGFPFGLELLQAGPFLRYKEIARGGNTKRGKTGGFGNCPCQMQYTVATIQVRFPARPNAAQIAGAIANPPAPDRLLVPCAGICIHVMTHTWTGWVLLQDLQTGQFLLNNHTFAQWHCKLPNDPDVEKPPKQTDPSNDNDVSP